MYATLFAAGLIVGGLALIAYAAAALKTKVRQAREERRFNQWHRKGDEAA